jgi:hypothetical protein
MPDFSGLSALRHDIDLDCEHVELDFGLKIHNFTFTSQGHELMLHAACDTGNLKTGPTALDPEYALLYQEPDLAVNENRTFRYHLLLPGDSPAKKLIILIHGFNERNWSKYLPWAAQLVKRTGQGVLMFPLAFHMNRAPKLWNNARAMRKVSNERQQLYPEVLQSTLSNAAISVRLHANPARFFWSGLVSYYDILDMVRLIRNGGQPGVDPGASINFFTYSIGSLLGEIVLFTNEDGLFDDSKMVCFCGGPVFNRLSPVTKFILDSEADVQLYSFLVEHLDSHRKTIPPLDRHLMSPVGRNFRCLLNYRLDRIYREDRFRTLADRLYALALAQDEVVPPYEIIGTFQGSQRDIDIAVEVMDLPYPYRHEDPFPDAGPGKAVADIWLNHIFKLAADFLA